MFTRLALLASPVRVLLSKTLLELDLGCQSADVGLVAAVVACADADTLAKKLLDDRHKRLTLGQVQTLECLVGCLDAAAQGRGVVLVKKRHAFVLEPGLEVGIGLESLIDTGGCEEGILPDGCAVTRLKAPVTLYLC